jgi:hypothetical protein
MWTARFGRGFGPVVRQTAEWLNKMCSEQRNVFETGVLPLAIESFV